MTPRPGPLLLLGAGGQARVCLEVAQSSQYGVLGFLDDDPRLHQSVINGARVLGPITQWRSVADERTRLVICIGNNLTRARLARELDVPPETFANVMHHSAVVMPSARIGVGNTIFTHTYIGPNAVVGGHTIVNNGVLIDHDCVIEDFASLSPGVALGGRVHIGKGVFVGVGASFRPGVSVGEGTIVGAGAAVVGDLPAHTLAYGVPARVVRDVQPDDWRRLV